MLSGACHWTGESPVPLWLDQRGLDGVGLGAIFLGFFSAEFIEGLSGFGGHAKLAIDCSELIPVLGQSGLQLHRGLQLLPGVFQSVHLPVEPTEVIVRGSVIWFEPARGLNLADAGRKVVRETAQQNAVM